ncbi:MBL fold metallo-hydrolase [Tissierella carlieri]|uniref:MBL fold metallo-hydrolase n=1 Tax=Tissierella carlieri TaxID=689904 RepID=UPI001C10E6A7|nr:MBL fold metallo-hydrolase [Tissierella carlieri]MBU5313831.1 MBL fold metallo-hydrolase [Tissierella carlieri]
MKINKVGNRGILFTFTELKESSYDCVTNVYVINGRKNFIICDTYLGSYYIREVKEYLEVNYGKKDYIIFNSHSHWDHIWGNSEFRDSIIVSHKICRDFIAEHGREELVSHAIEFAKEDIDIVLPNITFESKITFNDEGIEFFYSPGHSQDSASCYDLIDNVLFVGDNVDDPIPSYMCWNNLDKYKDTLEKYFSIGADIIVQSHGDIMDNEIIRSNIGYIVKLKANENMDFKKEDVLKKHIYNLEYLNGYDSK